MGNLKNNIAEGQQRAVTADAISKQMQILAGGKDSALGWISQNIEKRAGDARTKTDNLRLYPERKDYPFPIH